MVKTLKPVPERGVFLLVMLIVVAIMTALGAFINLFSSAMILLLGVVLDEASMTSITWPMLLFGLILVGLEFLALFGIFKWRNWGVYLYIFIMTLGIGMLLLTGTTTSDSNSVTLILLSVMMSIPSWIIKGLFLWSIFRKWRDFH